MSAIPYMKFYVGDYLGDTQHLTTLQHGAYLLLIMAYWQRRGPLPLDDEKLSRIARCAIAEWMQCKSDVLAFFDEREGMLYHNRIERELEGVAEVSEKRRGAAYKKWNTTPKDDASALQEDSKSNAKGMLSHIHSHIPYSDSNTEPKKEEEADKPPLPFEALSLAELIFSLHRDNIDKGYNPVISKRTRWAYDIDKLNRLDTRSWDDIEKVIRWVKTPGQFWAANIMSGKKLREKFPTLYAQMIKPNGNVPKVLSRTASLDMGE